ncbi:MAG: DNA double-strand break repair nuclease NurA [Candidatus Bathyarchaeia archaeon]
MIGEKATDWSRLPVDLQHQFFEHAREEAEKHKRKLLEQKAKLEYFSRFLKFEPVPEDDRWGGWRIASVDGSYSPATSERIGARYGAYCAGYMTFEGDEFVDEGYRSGELSQDQLGDPDLTLRVLSLLCIKLEREMALRCLEEEGVDLLLMDGSFFGFRTKLGMIRREEIDAEGFETVGELTEHIRDLSLRLLYSRRVVGVIKRVRINAFDGWNVYTHRDERHRIRRNDRAILASIMPPKHWFAYQWLFGSPSALFTYGRLSGLRDGELAKARESGKGMEDLYRRYERLVELDIKANLRCTAPQVMRTARYYTRCTASVAPMCFEAHKDVDVEPLVAYFQANHNPATGLPFPIDLIDQNVSLPQGFTKEFVEEVESLLIGDPELDKFDLSNYFMSINPQKEE